MLPKKFVRTVVYILIAALILSGLIGGGAAFFL